MRFTVLTIVLLCSFNMLYSQKKEVLTTESVLNMLTIGLSDEIIVSKITASDCQFDTSIEMIQTLKKAGVSDKIIVAMINKQKEEDIDNKENTIVRTGIYFVNHKQELSKLYPSVFSGTRTSTLGSAFSYGIASSKIHSTLNGRFSKNIIYNRKPQFYFFFDVQNNNNLGVNWWFSVASSPNQFTLARLHPRKNTRELGSGKVNLYSGTNIGIDEDDIIDVLVTTNNDYEYVVTPKYPLESGEYCFFYQGVIPMGGANQAVFDFSIPSNVAAFDAKYNVDDIVWVRLKKGNVKQMVITKIIVDEKTDLIYYEGYEHSDTNEMYLKPIKINKVKWAEVDCSYEKFNN